MYCESWGKINCLSCGVYNWVCFGDLEDFTVPDVDGFICWKCHALTNMQDDPAIDEDDLHFTKGYESPK